jgi:hypothetical protein
MNGRKMISTNHTILSLPSKSFLKTETRANIQSRKIGMARSVQNNKPRLMENSSIKSICSKVQSRIEGWRRFHGSPAQGGWETLIEIREILQIFQIRDKKRAARKLTAQ